MSTKVPDSCVECDDLCNKNCLGICVVTNKYGGEVYRCKHCHVNLSGIITQLECDITGNKVPK